MKPSASKAAKGLRRPNKSTGSAARGSSTCAGMPKAAIGSASIHPAFVPAQNAPSGGTVAGPAGLCGAPSALSGATAVHAKSACLPPLVNMPQDPETLLNSLGSIADFYDLPLEAILAKIRQADFKNRVYNGNKTKPEASLKTYGHTESSQTDADVQVCREQPVKWGKEYFVFYSLLFAAKPHPPLTHEEVPPFNAALLAQTYGITLDGASQVIKKLRDDGGKSHVESTGLGDQVKFKKDVFFDASHSPIGRFWMNRWAKSVRQQIITGHHIPSEPKTFYADDRITRNVINRLRFTKNGVQPTALKQLSLKTQTAKKASPGTRTTTVSILIYLGLDHPDSFTARPDHEAWIHNTLDNHADLFGYARIYTAEILDDLLGGVSAAFKAYENDLYAGVKDSIGIAPQEPGVDGYTPYRLLIEAIY